MTIRLHTPTLLLTVSFGSVADQFVAALLQLINYFKMLNDRPPPTLVYIIRKIKRLDTELAQANYIFPSSTLMRCWR